MSKKSHRLVPLSACLAALIASAPAVAGEKYQRSETPVFPEAQADRALVYVVRDEYPRVLSYGYRVFADLAPLGFLCRKCYLAAHVDPGMRFLWGPEQNITSLINLEAGKTYLLRLSERWAQSRVISTSWQPLDPTDIEDLVRTRKLSYASMTAEGVEALQEAGVKGFTKTRAKADDPPIVRAIGLGSPAPDAAPGQSAAPPPEASPAQATIEITIEEVIRAVESAEEFEKAGSLRTAPDLTRYLAAGSSADSIRGRLHASDPALSAHLEKNPTDLDALFLQVRLDRALVILTPVVISGGKVQPPDALGPKRDPQVTLDRILELSPENARALYMKARLHGIVAFRPGGQAELEKAIHLARRAVAKDPSNVEYREALAMYLVASEEESEALEVLKDVAGGRHPIHRLLMDRARLPWPAGAVPQKDTASGLAEMGMQAGRLKDNPFLRVAACAVPATPPQVEAFYRSRWKEFRLFKAKDRGAFTAEFDWRDDELVPTKRNPEKRQDLAGSFLVLFVLDASEAPPDVREQMRMPATGPISQIVAYNWRELGVQGE